MGIFNKLTGNMFAQVDNLGNLGLQDPLAKNRTMAMDKTAGLRLSIGFDAVTTAVMITNENHEIVHVNPAARKMMTAAHSDIRKEFPGFNVNDLVGSNINVFSKNPSVQGKMLDSLRESYHTEIAVGDWTFGFHATPMFEQGVRIGTVVEWQDLSASIKLQNKQNQQLENELKLTRDYEEIKAALNCMSNGVLLADKNHTIMYSNDSVVSLLKGVESEMQQVVPGFNAAELMGKSIDMFHKNPAEQHAIIDNLTGKHYARIQLGSKLVRMLLSPFFDANNQRRGTIVELRDLTTEVELENTALRAIEAATNGDLSMRINTEHQVGNMQNVFKGINGLFDTMQQVIEETTEAMGAVANGELTRTIQTEYKGAYGQLRDDINNTIKRLVDVVREIRETAGQVKSGAGEISSGNSNLSHRTEEQAASLEETSAAMEQITSTVQQNAANAVQANTLARGARETAENGGQVVGQAVAAMDAISTSSNKINDIIGVIDEIAFQTNLLALNAAVEAARAGDQGRGFAVVADEVRNLAGRSATAAKEIKELIKDSSEKVREGSLLVNKSGSTLDEIVTAVKKVNDIVAEISTASDEQATGLDEINRAVGEMDEMTQQNAALVEQAAAASEALGTQSETLEALIAFFKIGDEGRVKVQVQAKVAKAPPVSRKPAAPVSRKPVAPTSRQPAAPARKLTGKATTTPSTRPVARTAVSEKPKAPVKTAPARKSAPVVREDDDKNWAEF